MNRLTQKERQQTARWANNNLEDIRSMRNILGDNYVIIASLYADGSTKSDGVGHVDLFKIDSTGFLTGTIYNHTRELGISELGFLIALNKLLT